MKKAPGLTLRPATATDIPALHRLETDSFDSDRISRRSFRNFIERETASLVVADTGDEIAGYFLLLFRRGTAMARLYSIAVAKAFQGMGISAALMNRAEEICYEHERMLLRLEVREDNARAIALYRKRGYRPIGKYLDYYADHTDALRFEKTVRGDTPVETGIPFYEQTTDFTCGPACLQMAFAHFLPGYKPDAIQEIRLWREATTVFMMSGTGGCDPYGLAVAAHEAGIASEIHVSRKGVLFGETVRDPEKRMVMELAQADFRSRVKAYGITVHHHIMTIERLRREIGKGKLAIVLVSGYAMFGKKVPHWVLVHGDDGRHFLIHDPWVEDETGETLADAANLPIPHKQFDRMSRFGKDMLRAAVILNSRKETSKCRNG